MNGPVALLHVVGGKEVGNLSKLVEQVILETEHGSRADNGGLGVNGTGNFLSPGLYRSA